MVKLEDFLPIEELETLQDAYARMNDLWDRIIAIKELAKKIDAKHYWLLEEIETLQEKYEQAEKEAEKYAKGLELDLESDEIYGSYNEQVRKSYYDSIL